MPTNAFFYTPRLYRTGYIAYSNYVLLAGLPLVGLNIAMLEYPGVRCPYGQPWY